MTQCMVFVNPNKELLKIVKQLVSYKVFYSFARKTN